jgi:hypothetical protein
LKIVIGSVLKPLDDVRHYHKLALSLAEMPQNELFILARAVPYPLIPKKETITFQSIISSQPNRWERWLAPWKFLLFILKVKPELVIVCTHELLIVIVLYRILFGSRIVYDIQENYAENVLQNASLSPILKGMVSRWIGVKERLCAPFVSQFWLAEACYAQELSFVRDESLVLENKSLFFRETGPITLASSPHIRLLFSGTVAEENGVFEAVHLVIALHQLDKRYHLHIIGCCHQVHTERKLREMAALHADYIQLDVSNLPMSYEVIREAIFHATMGLVCYRPQKNFKDKMPTKLYEYSAAGLPVLLQQNSLWEQYCHPLQNALIVDFQEIDYKEIHWNIQKYSFYPSGNKAMEKCTWQEEAQKLIMNS